MNPFGILTNMERGDTPRYNTFALTGRNPYGLPPGVGPREPHYDPWPNRRTDYRGLSMSHGFSSSDICKMQVQLDEVGANHLFYQNHDPYIRYDGFRRSMTPYNMNSDELFDGFGGQFAGSCVDPYEIHRSR